MIKKYLIYKYINKKNRFDKLFKELPLKTKVNIMFYDYVLATTINNLTVQSLIKALFKGLKYIKSTKKYKKVLDHCKS